MARVFSGRFWAAGAMDREDFGSFGWRRSEEGVYEICLVFWWVFSSPVVGRDAVGFGHFLVPNEED